MFGRKSGVDMVDFTRTKSGKRIAPPKEIAPSVGGFLDFTSQTNPTPSAPAADTPNTFGFLSDFSQAAATPAQDSFFSSSPSPAVSSIGESHEVTSLKIKVEDLEFKLERLLERLAEMETKFGRI